MDPGPPESKRPRLAAPGSSWPAGSHLLHPTPSPTHSQHSSTYSSQPPQHQHYQQHPVQSVYHQPQLPHQPSGSSGIGPGPGPGQAQQQGQLGHQGQQGPPGHYPPPPPPPNNYPPPSPNSYASPSHPYSRPPPESQHHQHQQQQQHPAPPPPTGHMLLGPSSHHPPHPPPPQSHPYPPHHPPSAHTQGPFPPQPPQHPHTPQPPQQGPHAPSVPAAAAAAGAQIDERRHHEVDRFPPMQEQRHPVPSPVLPPPGQAYHGYSGREPVVKQDPGGPGGEDGPHNHLAQLRRPQSTGHSNDGLRAPPTPQTQAQTQGPPPAHSSVPPQPQPQQQQQQQSLPDDRRHMSFDSGPQPTGYNRQPSYAAAPPTPASHGLAYEYGPSPSYGPAHGEIPYGIPMTISGKRKAQRASQACDSCRALKAKCDEMKPCKSCKEKKVECKYRDPAPKVQDKMTSEIMDAILLLHSDVTQMTQRFGRLERAMSKAGIKMEQDEDERRPTSGGSAYKYSSSPDNAATGASGTGIGIGSGMAAERDTPRLLLGTGHGEAQMQQQVIQAPMQVQEIQPVTDCTVLEELIKEPELDDENPPGPPVVPGPPAIPPNHTTGASLLFQWGPIRQLVQPFLDRENIKFVQEFPIKQEQGRGLIRVYGRGEGTDTTDNKPFSEREANLEVISTDAFDDYATSDAGVSSPTDCWGPIWGPSPTSGTVIANESSSETLLDFSAEKVMLYVRSFHDNIQNMHPLIAPRELDALVHLFLANVEQSRAKYKPGVAGYPGESGIPPSKRRKRSESMDGPDVPMLGKPSLQRTIQTALVLLVLALGKICLHKTKIPDPMSLMVEPFTSHPSSMVGHSHGNHGIQGTHGHGRNGYSQSPSQGSPPAAMNRSFSSGFGGAASPFVEAHHHGGHLNNSTSSRRTSSHGGGAPMLPMPKPVRHYPRNMDVIPGMDYFAIATDILGNQHAGSTMKHVTSHILAGLYYGQLGRVMESYSHIATASYRLLMHMRPRMNDLAEAHIKYPFASTAVQHPRNNQLVIAFWSCLQLESDIIAELNLQQSPILQYENQMPYPNPYLGEEAGFDLEAMDKFIGQLYLRRSLNEVHTAFYDPKKPITKPDPETMQYYVGMFDLENKVLQAIRAFANFKITDPPATDILNARLWAKLWGARNIIYRPFIRYIVQSNFERTPDSPPISVDEKSLEYAKAGIKALIESTRAFHGLREQRFIITNVFGTAHAQWGNLLVLSAVYRDPTLSKFLQKDLLEELFVKTIAFFKTVAHQTSALSIDMRILEGLHRELFGCAPRSINATTADMAAPNTSFSSTNSGPATLAPLAPSHTPPNAIHLPSMDAFRPPPRHI